jgi:hypothetical protein
MTRPRNVSTLITIIYLLASRTSCASAIPDFYLQTHLDCSIPLDWTTEHQPQILSPALPARTSEAKSFLEMERVLSPVSLTRRSFAPSLERR